MHPIALLLSELLPLFLVVMFGYAGIAKVLDPAATLRLLEHTTGSSITPFSVPLLASVEIILAIGVLFRPTRRLAMGLSMLSLVGFAALLVIAVRTGFEGSCGCLGPAGPSARTMVKLDFLAVVLIAIWFLIPALPRKES